MKPHLFSALVASASLCAHGQGTFIYDQQSSTDPGNAFGGPIVQQYTSLGQSFTPTLSAVSFVQLAFFDANAGNSLGATVYLNLRSSAFNGPVLASSAPVFMPDGFGIGSGSASVTNFFFGPSVTLTPGATYFFEPIVQSGDNWAVSMGEGFNYPGGGAFANGSPVFMVDFWFREGIVVPEPGTWALLLIGCGLLAWRRRFFP